MAVRTATSVHPAVAASGRWSVLLGGVRLSFGDGALDTLPELVGELGGERVLVVTDPGVRATGSIDRAARSLAAAVETVEIFDGVAENPTTEHVERGTGVARERGVDLIVGIGGGSAMDAAKGINFLATNGGRMEDYWGTNKASRPMLPSIGVPTTAGTGSEAQSYALIAQAGTHRKMACGDDKARFRAVILDPALTATVPRPVAAATGFDAISHAVESHVTCRRNPISALYSRRAWELLSDSFARSLDGDDGRARAAMLLGAHLAGAAIECSMLGAAHACANPLTARYGITHGIAVGLMLPHVVRFNRETVGELYAELDGNLPARLEELWASTGQPARLRDHGVARQDLDELADGAAEQWTAGFNPRPVERQDLLTLYENAL